MTVDADIDKDFRDLVDSFFSREVDTSGELVPRFDTGMWEQLHDLGLTQLTTSESRGGSGASWYEAMTLHRLAAYHGASLPLVDHDLLADWLIERLDLASEEGLATVNVVDPRGAVTMEHVVPWGRHAERMLIVFRGVDACWRLVDARQSQLELREATSLAGEPRDLVRLPDQLGSRPLSDEIADELLLRGALARSIQVAGALDRCVDLAIEHAAVRTQFGRPLARFQAVQALLADAAGEAALANAAVAAAVASYERHGGGADRTVEVAVASAKSCASHAAGVVSRNAHQVIGAIGTTTEHELHRPSARALVWRSEFGTSAYWDRRLAEAAVSVGENEIWSVVAG